VPTEGDKGAKPVAESKKPAPEVSKPVPDAKPAPAPTASDKPRTAPPPPAEEPAARNEPSLGEVIAGEREKRGLSQEAAARDAHIPPNYLRMIENDDYSSISDQLYLLPFLRRYAIFVGLDPEEVASRFVRDVQRADMNATRMSEPIQMLDPRGGSAVRVVIIAVIVAAVVALGWFGYRRFYHPHRIASAPIRFVQPSADASLA
jgi:transcriptional regulator with XRE-family HTH domain